MKVVYIVLVPWNDGTEVVGVFLTREEANKIVAYYDEVHEMDIHEWGASVHEKYIYSKADEYIKEKEEEELLAQEMFEDMGWGKE